MSLIELKDVSKLYGFGDATTIALDEVSLNVEKGEFIAIMGPSGSGKTTLLNVAGLLDVPTHGTYKLNNRDVARLKPNKQAKHRRDHIGFVFQSFNLLPRLNILQNVALPLAYRGYTQRRRLKAAASVIDQMGLSDREYYYPRQLSGGQLQRASIARALVNNPSIIIADEPTGNLDSTSTRVVMELLSEVNMMGNTILMVTHNPSLTRYASRVIYMRDGSIVYDEQTAIGEIPDPVKRVLGGRGFDKQEDDLLAVSALMNSVDGKATPSRNIGTKKPSRKKSKKAKK
ncbi:MAG: ABC transporter ATP-binding protein [bacterium]|nr:ABC transporter ATP-binding protein [bacterium]